MTFHEIVGPILMGIIMGLAAITLRSLLRISSKDAFVMAAIILIVAVLGPWVIDRMTK